MSKKSDRDERRGRGRLKWILSGLFAVLIAIGQITGAIEKTVEFLKSFVVDTPRQDPPPGTPESPPSLDYTALRSKVDELLMELDEEKRRDPPQPKRIETLADRSIALCEEVRAECADVLKAAVESTPELATLADIVRTELTKIRDLIEIEALPSRRPPPR